MPEDPPAGQPAKAAAIRAVSELLSRKKRPFGEPSAPARFPKFPGSVDAALARLRKSPVLRAKFDPPAALVDPPPVGLPVGPPETPAEEPPALDGPPPPETPKPAQAPAPVVPGVVKAMGGDPVPSTSSAPKSSEVAPGTFAAPGPDGARPSPPPSGLGDGRGSAGIPVAPLALAGIDPRPVAALATPPALAPPAVPGRPGERPELPAARVAGVEFPREIAPGPGGMAGEAEVSGPELSDRGPGYPGVLPDRGPSISVAVRRPISSLAGGLSPGPPDEPGEGPAPRFDPSAAGGLPAFGGPDPHQAGATADLSKTNELLRQLIDAVKRQRDASLPVGGPLVYPGR